MGTLISIKISPRKNFRSGENLCPTEIFKFSFFFLSF